jgi:D-sedoheptulose 7-phosphate isomerase
MIHSQKIKEVLLNSASIKEKIANDEVLVSVIENMTEIMVKAFKNGKKVLFCGNGGSAGDAQHIAAELSGRFYKNRAPLYAEALHVNGSYMTAVANDYGYDYVFSRMVEAQGKEGDVLVGISTSGNSLSVVNAIKEGSKKGMTTISFLGGKGGEMLAISDVSIVVPSNDTPRIQEAHITIGHILCELIENTLFPNE